MGRLWADAESAYRARILDSLRVDPSAVLLDVGCDDGAWTDEIRKRLGIPPQQVHGIELVAGRAALARGRGFDVLIGDLDQRWPFDDRSIDIVHANQVIEHVKRLDHFVGEITRILAPRGFAIICTENLASWHNVAALVLGHQPFSLTNISNIRFIGNRFALHAEELPPGEAAQHIHVVTLTALRDICAAHGLIVEAAWGTGYHPLPGRLAGCMATLDPRHAHFIAVVARRGDRDARLESAR